MQKIGFILVPGFALMSYASATEPLRAANLLAGRELYRIIAYSPDGGPIEASSGAVIPTAPVAATEKDLDTIFVCAGGDPSQWRHPRIWNRLRRHDRDGVRIGGISGGPYLLAAAGLLGNRCFTIHWEHASALMEGFPGLVPERARYVMDGNRITCGGGIAPMDMMNAFIAERMGRDFARRVSDWYLHTHVGGASESQRASLSEKYRTHNAKLLGILEKMENTVEMPMDRAAMARFAGIGERHLNRLFAAHLGSTFTKTYLRIRIDFAARLLRQSAMPVAEVALASGFSSPSHFSRTFLALAGHPPRDERRRQFSGTVD